MNHSAFDEHFKKQFGDFQPEVPPHIWENIVNNRQKRRPIAWWNRLLNNRNILLTVTALLLGTAGYFIFLRNNPHPSLQNNQPSNPAPASNPFISSHSTSPNNPANQPANSNQPAATQPITQDQPGTPVIPTTTADAAVQPASHHTKNDNLSTQDLAAATKQPKARPGYVNQPDATGSTKNGPTDRAFSGIGGNRSRGGKQVGWKQNGEINQAMAGNTTGKNKRQRKDGQQRLSIDFSAPDATHADNSTVKTDGTPAATYETMADLNRKVFDWQKLKDEKSFKHRFIHKSLNVSPIPCPEKNAAGNKKYLEVYGAGDYAFRTFNDTAHSQYLQKRKESTKITSGFSAGFRYTRVFSNAMSFRLGLNYSQVNEKFTFVQGNIIQVVYITNSNGDTIGSNMTSSTRYKVTHNRYKTIDVPLTIGYEMGNEKLHANINAGVIMNLYSWQKGDVLDSSYKPVSITTGKNTSPYQFKTNIGLGFTAAASIYYKIGERWHLLAEPYIRYNLSPANKADITLKQKFTTIGLRLGLRFDL